LIRRVALGPLTIEPALRGAWFDVRARLPQGNLAASQPIWIPGLKPPVWPSDEVTTHVVAIIAKVKNGPVTRDTPLDVFEALKVSAEVLREFKVSVPANATTAGAVVDAVKKALLDKAVLTSVILRFTNAAGQQVNASYMLSSGSRTYNGTSGVELYVEPGVYEVSVLLRALFAPIAPISLQVGQSIERTIVLRTREAWPNDDVARRLRVIIAREVGIAQDDVLPSSDFGNSDRLEMQGLLRGMNAEFGIELTEADLRKVNTSGDLLNVVRRLLKSAPLAVTVRFTDADGKALQNVDFVINGKKESSETDGIAELKLRRGTYKVEYEGETATLRVPPNAATLVVHSRPHTANVPDVQQTAPLLSDEAIKNITWSIGDPGELECAGEVEKMGGAECIGNGNRACLMKLAIRAAAAGSCDAAFQYTLVTQCHNPNARNTILNAGRDAVCTYLRRRAATGE
jgi:hypothetical protein